MSYKDYRKRYDHQKLVGPIISKRVVKALCDAIPVVMTIRIILNVLKKRD